MENLEDKRKKKKNKQRKENNHFFCYFRGEYAMRHNDARGWGGGGGVIAYDVLKIRKVIEFQNSWIVIYYKIHFRFLLQPMHAG